MTQIPQGNNMFWDVQSAVTVGSSAGGTNVSAYNLNGQHIETIYSGFAASNTVYNVNWDASKLSSGLYIIKVDATDFKYSKVVSLLK